MAIRGKGFPRISLASAVKVIESASKFGREWSKDAFAAYGSKKSAGSAKSGAYILRLSALKDYGLITVDKDKIISTELTQKIVKPLNGAEKADAIREAFLRVNTFSQIYSSLNSNVSLEKSAILEYAVREIGISRDSMNKFFNSFVDSGKYAGLIEYNKNEGLVIIRNKNEGLNIGTPKTANDIGSTDSTFTHQAILPQNMASIHGASSVGRSSGIMNEQGVNHSGEGWALTVIIKSSHRLPAELRKSIRDLLESADIVADAFYSLEKGGGVLTNF